MRSHPPASDREMGRLIREKQEAGELAKKGESKYNSLILQENKRTLPEIGVTLKESSTSKNLVSIAGVPGYRIN